MSRFNIMLFDSELQKAPPCCLEYDNEKNCLFINGERVYHTPVSGITDLHCRIMLGHRCNMNCQYCMQQKGGPEPSKDVAGFVRDFSRFTSGRTIGSLTFEGGETLLYFDDMVAYHDALMQNYPQVPFKAFFTNGLLVDDKIVDWCIENNMQILLSHDGPGQFVRGMDPLDNKNTRQALQRYIDSGMRIGFTPTYHRYNYVLGTYLNTMREKLNFNDNQFMVASFLNMYIMDEHMQELAIPEGQLVECHRETYLDIVQRLPWLSNWSYLESAVSRFIGSIGGPPKFKFNCKATDPNRVFMDTYGNITSCGFYHHNDCDVDTGELAGLGRITDMHVSDSRVKRQSKWERRLETHCSKCPLLQVCMGTCPFTPEKYFKQSCKNHYYYRMLIFAIAIYRITGNIMTGIDFDINSLWED